jgi:solute:Na+ symporter, SSS family
VYLSLSWLLPLLPWWREQMNASEATLDTMVMLQALVAIVLTTVLWFVVTWLTPPESNETLASFYVRARPLGMWGRVRKSLETSAAGVDLPNEPAGLLWGGLCVAAIGAVWISCGVLAVSQLTVGKFGTAAALLAAFAALATVFRIGFRWHMNRLEAE